MSRQAPGVLQACSRSSSGTLRELFRQAPEVLHAGSGNCLDKLQEALRQTPGVLQTQAPGVLQAGSKSSRQARAILEEGPASISFRRRVCHVTEVTVITDPQINDAPSAPLITVAVSRYRCVALPCSRPGEMEQRAHERDSFSSMGVVAVDSDGMGSSRLSLVAVSIPDPRVSQWHDQNLAMQRRLRWNRGIIRTRAERFLAAHRAPPGRRSAGACGTR